jgi:hypothetical protein
MELFEKAIKAFAKTTPEALRSGPPLSRFQAYILYRFSTDTQRDELPDSVTRLVRTVTDYDKEMSIYVTISKMALGLSHFQLPDLNGSSGKHGGLWDAYIMSVCEAALQLTRDRKQTLTNIKKEVELKCANSIDAVIKNKYSGTILEPHMRTFLLGVTTSALAEFIPDVTSYPEK